MHPALYRSYQFFAAVKASLPRQLSPADAALVQSVLPTAAQQQLFACMPSNDQRHAVAVARMLQQAGHTHPALLQAALLHDVAKSIGQPILHRVAIVLLAAFWPALLARLAATEAHVLAVAWWRRPFVVHAHHPSIGAEWAGQANCLPLAVSLILRHQDKLAGPPATPADELLAALQWADNLN